MKLGLFDHMQKHDNPARSYVDLYKNHLEVLEFADLSTERQIPKLRDDFCTGRRSCAPGCRAFACDRRVRVS